MYSKMKYILITMLQYNYAKKIFITQFQYLQNKPSLILN